jgi:hypothetical protein
MQIDIIPFANLAKCVITLMTGRVPPADVDGEDDGEVEENAFG